MMYFSSYEFAVHVNDKANTEYPHQGETYIEGRKGSKYELFFKNNTYEEVLVVFSVEIGRAHV